MADPVVYEFIRGDDFALPMNLRDPENNGDPVNLTGWTITSMVRYSKKLVSELTVEITNPTGGQFTLKADPSVTGLWPARQLKCDIQFDRPSEGRVSSNTFIIDVKEDQTYV